MSFSKIDKNSNEMSMSARFCLSYDGFNSLRAVKFACPFLASADFFFFFFQNQLFQKFLSGISSEPVNQDFLKMRIISIKKKNTFLSTIRNNE